MDSLGRRVYGVDDKTFERELRTYFNRNFEDRVSARMDGGESRYIADGGKKSENHSSGLNVLNTISTIFRVLILVFTFYTLYTIGKTVMEEMEKAKNEDGTDHEGDVFDKMFGSEFKGKFKNSRQNKGVYQQRQEELKLKYNKDESNTTPPDEIKRIVGSELPNNIKNIVHQFWVSTEDVYKRGTLIRQVVDIPEFVKLYRLVYKGYTYRELMSPKTNMHGLLKDASQYIIGCYKQNNSK